MTGSSSVAVLRTGFSGTAATIVDSPRFRGRLVAWDRSHAVRRNLGDRFAEQAMTRWQPGTDLWAILFELANSSARAESANDLVPFWIAPGDWRVLRHVPLLPYSREVEAFRRLKRQLAAYRVVFGQPRQEELMALLDNSMTETSELKKWVIDLTPQTNS